MSLSKRIISVDGKLIDLDRIQNPKLRRIVCSQSFMFWYRDGSYKVHKDESTSRGSDHRDEHSDTYGDYRERSEHSDYRSREQSAHSEHTDRTKYLDYEDHSDHSEHHDIGYDDEVKGPYYSDSRYNEYRDAGEVHRDTRG